MVRVALYRKLNMVQRVASFAAGPGISLSTSGSISEPDEIVLNIAATGGGGGGTPATTVVSETSPGQSPVIGTSTDYARGDHSHGTPALPAHNTLSNLAWINAAHTGAANAVAAWNEFGVSTVSQATADETMLVRRGGTLQWVPIVASVVFLPSSDLIIDGKVFEMNGAVVFPGSIL
jgi:hypothetical protein